MEDVEIARSTKLKNIQEIAEKLDIKDDELELYGKHKAKISFNAIERMKNKKNGKLILVTAINPTPLGEGKTTMAIGLADRFTTNRKKLCISVKRTFTRTSFWN